MAMTEPYLLLQHRRATRLEAEPEPEPEWMDPRTKSIHPQPLWINLSIVCK